LEAACFGFRVSQRNKDRLDGKGRISGGKKGCGIRQKHTPDSFEGVAHVLGHLESFVVGFRQGERRIGSDEMGWQSGR